MLVNSLIGRVQLAGLSWNLETSAPRKAIREECGMKRSILMLVALALMLPAAALQAQEQQQQQVMNNEAAEKFNEGKSLYLQGKYEEALAALQESAKLEPGNYLAHYMLGMTYEKLRQPDAAIEQLEAAIRHNTNYYAAYYQLGLVYQRSKNDPDKAIESYQKAGEVSEQLGSPHIKTFQNMGAIFYQQQKWDEALMAYSKVTQYEPTNEKAFDYIGLINIEKGQYEDAMMNFTQAAQRKPAWFEPYWHQAMALNKLGNWDRAIAAADEALSRMPNHGGSLYEKGTALQAQEKWDEAIKVFESAAKDAIWRQLANHQIEIIKNRDKYVIPPDKTISPIL